MSKKGRKKQNDPGHAPNHERWVISYADLLTLLLATFVVLYASSVRDKLKEDQVAEAFVKAFHGSPSTVIVTKPTGSQGVLQHNVSPIPNHDVAAGSKVSQQNQKIDQQISKDLDNIKEISTQLQTMFQPEIDKNQIAMNNTPLTLSISLNDSVLFASGQTDLKPEAQILLAKIANGLMKLPAGYQIVVRGYTDDQPISTPQFPSNWSLSAERAVSVVQLFLKSGIQGNALGAEGFGKYDPIASNATADGRYQNRRVVILVQAPSPDGRSQSNSLSTSDFSGNSSSQNSLNVKNSSSPINPPVVTGISGSKS